jgi:hypothetical protein
MIQGTDHMYAEHQNQVANIIANWADTLLPPNSGKGETDALSRCAEVLPSSTVHRFVL